MEELDHIISILDEANEDIKNGRVAPIEETFDEIKKNLNDRVEKDI